MKSGAFVATLMIALAFQACQIAKSGTSSENRAMASASNSLARKPDFDSEIKPIFQARCQPCHFQGGKVYDKLPFDKPETITKLGTKLFTRIKDQKEQQRIREFLAQP